MLKPLNKHFAPKSVMPEKVIQFGEGNFLRASYSPSTRVWLTG